MRGSSPRMTPSVKANAPPPLFFAARGRRRLSPAAALERTEGARDAKGPDGPAGFDASRHRGLSKSALLRACALRRVFRKSTKSDGVPRAVLEACSAKCPGSRRIYAPVGAHYPWKGQALGLEISDKPPAAGRQGPSARTRSRRTLRGLDRRAVVSHLRHRVIPRPPLPAPYLRCLIRHPSVTRAG